MTFFPLREFNKSSPCPKVPRVNKNASTKTNPFTKQIYQNKTKAILLIMRLKLITLVSLWGKI